MHCKYCGSDDHPWFNCRKKPEGWKPPKELAGPLTEKHVSQGRVSAMSEVATRSFKSTAARKDVRPAEFGDGGHKGAEADAEASVERGRSDRHNSHTVTIAGTQVPPVDTQLGRKRDDGPSQGKSPRAAAMRDYMRKWRAKRKAKE